MYGNSPTAIWLSLAFVTLVSIEQVGGAGRGVYAVLGRSDISLLR